MTNSYNLGVVCGIVFTIIIVALIWKLLLRGKKKPIYDERQLIEQGKAGKIGFYSLMILNAIYAVAVDYLGIKIATFEGVFIMVLIAVGIYAVICIWKEAYFPINQSSRRLIAGLFAIGILNIIGGYRGSSIDTQNININYMCAALMFAIAVVSIIKLRSVQKSSMIKADDDEEFEA